MQTIFGGLLGFFAALDLLIWGFVYFANSPWPLDFIYIIVMDFGCLFAAMWVIRARPRNQGFSFVMINLRYLPYCVWLSVQVAQLMKEVKENATDGWAVIGLSIHEYFLAYSAGIYLLLLILNIFYLNYTKINIHNSSIISTD